MFLAACSPRSSAAPRFVSICTVPIASGLIAGASLMGVAIVALEIADARPLE